MSDITRGIAVAPGRLQAAGASSARPRLPSPALTLLGQVDGLG
jgi:hypothetical protein